MSRKVQKPPIKKPNLNLTPNSAGQTEKVTLFLTKELMEKVNNSAWEMFGKRKGAISLYMEQALRIVEHMHVPGVQET